MNRQSRAVRANNAWPSLVRRHTNQSGLIGFENQGSAQPAAIAPSIRPCGTSCPSAVNHGSLPPGAPSPRRNQAICRREGTVRGFWGAEASVFLCKDPLPRLDNASTTDMVLPDR
jgi:hypothetical protein